MPVKLADIADSLLIKASERFSNRIDRIEMVLQNAKRTSYVAMDTKDRLQRFKQRESSLSAATTAPSQPRQSEAIGLERTLGPSNDMLPIEFLEAGVEAGKAVGRLEYALGAQFGTGFFVSPAMILTNHHVIRDKAMAAATTFETFAESNLIGERRISCTFDLDPETFFLTNPDLDFTIVAVDSSQSSTTACGWLPLLEELGKILIGHPVSVIQHPGGNNKKVVIHNSLLLDLEDTPGAESFCWYSADTEEGSSGAPVFNNRWEVVALHHKSVPRRNINGEILDINGKVMSEERFRVHPEMVHWVANEGIRTSRIVRALRSSSFTEPAMAEARDKLLALWSHPKARRPGLKQGYLSEGQ